MDHNGVWICLPFKSFQSLEILFCLLHVAQLKMFDSLCIRPLAASHSRGAKPPCWRARVALGQDKQKKLPFEIIYAFYCDFCSPAWQFCTRWMASCKGLMFAFLQNPKHKRGCLFSSGIDTVCACEFTWHWVTGLPVWLWITYRSQLWFKVPFRGINSLFQGFRWWGVKFFFSLINFLFVIYHLNSWNRLRHLQNLN